MVCPYDTFCNGLPTSPGKESEEVGHSDSGGSSETWKPALNRLIEALVDSCRQWYGDRLVSIVLFGSVARGTSNPYSDVDVLIVAEPLPKGRIQRVREFGSVEQSLQPLLSELSSIGCHVEISPVFKTPEEVLQGTPLMLDMVEDARMLHDRSNFFANALNRLNARLKALGSKRVWRANAWWWDLKPDYRRGNVFDI